jgi:dienelactone hydrolase
MKHLLLVVALSANLATAAHAAPLVELSGGQTGRIEFNSITPQSIWSYARKNTTDTKSVTVWGDLLMPKNTSGKVPAVIYSHGSTGATAAAFDVWAKELNNAGVALFVVDSYKPRGISETQTNQDQLSPGGQIADALNALKLLATHPKIDATRIFNMGFSRGGSIAYYTAWPMYQRPVETAGVRFAAHLAIYPGLCEIRYRADASDKATAPIFMALGTKDDIINESTCKNYMAEVAANGNNVTVKSYQGAYHGWDTLNRFGYLQNSHGAYNCNMELQMTDKPGGGVGMNAKDIKNSKALSSYDDWNAAVKGCMQHKPMSYGGDDKQRAALVKDVLDFMGVK